ncbi:hypothetical protein VZT92_024041 [Zoarces viviparus]|uniref:Uncharacterized protein n=1 Tax=Zoarces viviparus TaxID=48416 RepID=A0AAW1E0B1_ZOAVI
MERNQKAGARDLGSVLGADRVEEEEEEEEEVSPHLQTRRTEALRGSPLRLRTEKVGLRVRVRRYSCSVATVAKHGSRKQQADCQHVALQTGTERETLQRRREARPGLMGV